MTDVDEPVARDLPPYRSLPLLPSGARSGWHVFGQDDEVGLLNLQTPARVAQAARLVVTGETFPLDADLTLIDPPLFGRGAARHMVTDSGERWDLDDKLDNFYPQASSQWDSLAHVGYAPDQFYNGATLHDVTTGRKNSIAGFAARGIAGRAVLIDVEALLAAEGAYDPGTHRGVTVDEIERARSAAGLTWQAGDVMLMHTGYLRWYSQQTGQTRVALAALETPASVGLARGPEMLEYLWDSQISAVASDNPAVEELPFDLSPEAWPFGFLHQCLIGQLGLALGELWWLHDLAEACRRHSRYEMFLTAAPLHLPGGIGSPANAVAIL